MWRRLKGLDARQGALLRQLRQKVGKMTKMKHQLRNNRINRRGFTLAEAMMATVVLGVAAVGVLLPFTSGAAVRAEGMRRTLGAKLAGDLIEEIMTVPFDEIAAKCDEYPEPQGQVKDAAGTVFTDLNYAKFSRDASCVYVPQQSAASPRFIYITVNVYYSGRQIAAVSQLVSEYQ